MSAKHTPGPWAADADGSLVAVSGGKDSGRIVAELARADGRSVGGTKAMDAAMEANARLIAAAPQLLAALVAARKQLGKLTFKDGEIAAAIESATRAIYKATEIEA